MQCILERATRSLLAQVEEQNERLVAVPLDDRLLTSLELPGADAIHLDASQYSVVEVKIDRFPVGQFAARGHVERSLPIHGGVESPTRPAAHQTWPAGTAAAPRATLRHRHQGSDRSHGADHAAAGGLGSSEAPGLPALALEPRETGPAGGCGCHAPAVAERLGPGS